MIVILGGGLAGLSTAYHLGDTPHLVLEAEPDGGGLCRTREIDGFYFDYTGHLLHLRDPRVIGLVERLIPGAFREIARKAVIHSRGATLPFPFQANLYGLPPEIVADCVTGFAQSLGRPIPDDAGASFHDWSLAVFGQGISNAFMFPYNRKLFRRDSSEMTADWVSWAVPKPNLEEVVRGALGLHNEGMGYNSTFRYPARGGIDAVPRAFAARVKNVRYEARVTAVDLDRKTVVLSDGDRIDYDRLVVTIPLPSFLRMASGGPFDLAQQAERLDWSVVACWNVGIDRPDVGGGVHWIYFPDADAPFYRVGFPTNFSDGVAPPGTSSMYVEFGLRRGERPDLKTMEAAALDALRREGILRERDRVVVGDWIVIDPGYVIFDRDRQDVMRRVPPALETLGVHLAGRYGAWTYSYMERAILDGLEVAETLRGAGPARATG
jgi:protoporphyrinogen oxidase